MKDLVYCADISQLLVKLGVPQYKPKDWRLFIDSSKRSLKCVLLHNGNQFASVPIAHSTTLKKKYEAVKYVLEKIGYDQYKWFIWVDLKMVNILLEQQCGFKKYPCFLCMWDSRDRAQHYTKKDWPLRKAENSMNEVELEARKAFFLVVKNFLGNNKARNYADLVNNMLTAFRNLGCNMSIKMHYLFSHIDRFPENPGRWGAVMMADYCKNLKRDLPAAEHSRSSKKRKFKPWSLNNGKATCNLRVLTFINAHHSVYRNRSFYQVINICFFFFS